MHVFLFYKILNSALEIPIAVDELYLFFNYLC